MKRTLVLLFAFFGTVAYVQLLTLFGTLAYAQPAQPPIYRCEDPQGEVEFRDRPCTQSNAPAPQSPPVEVASFEARRETARVAPRYVQNEWNSLARNDYAANRRRCRSATQVAALCGKFAGMFSCNERGFVRESHGSATLNGSHNAFQMDQCALQATKGGD